MAYSDFTIPELKKKFNLSINEDTNIFEDIVEIEIPATLIDILCRYLPLSLNLNTEKARSELIIAPVLVELTTASLFKDKFGLFWTICPL